MENNKIEFYIDELISKFTNEEITKKEFKDQLICLVNDKHISLKPTKKIIQNNVKIEGNPLVEIKNLTKQYKGRKQQAISNISFNIYPGQFHAFIGANGAGKTTTIKSIISAYSKYKYTGEIKINGYYNYTSEGKSLLGYIPEEAKFPKKMSTKTYLMNMANLSGLSKSEAKQKVNSIINNLGINELSNKCPESFSSGQKKKILLAQALIHNPKVLIMDEPAANLDPLARNELFDNLLKLQQEGKAIFLSSHILDEVGKYATYVTILDGGKIVYDGTVNNHQNLNDLYRKYVKLGSTDNSTNNN